MQIVHYLQNTDETSIEKPQIALRGNMWNSREYSSNCTNEANAFLCPMEFKCRGVYSFVWIDFEEKNESFQILDIEIFGYGNAFEVVHK